MNPHFVSRRARGTSLWLSALLAAAVAAGCGGDEQIARTGGSGTGVGTTIGTVTGFGSIIVDSEAWDERLARVEIERNPVAGSVPAEVRLGQRVQLDFEARGRADRILLDPEVVGRVSGIDASGFKAAGQTVRVNADPAAGPVTLFDGLSGLAALQVGDAVEVHGSARFDAGLGSYVVVASRVEKLAALPAGVVRVAGVVTSLVAAERRFALGELTVTATASTVQVPANRALAEGQRVIVWSDDPIVAGSAGPTLTADFIRIVERTPGNDGRSTISGAVGRLDINMLTFDVGGVPVNARAAIVVPANQTLADGRYVIVSGSFDSTGVMQARQVRIRKGDASDSEIRLDGTITDFVSLANFRVRGVPVNAAGVNALPGCPAGGPANGVFVETGGQINAATGRVDANRLRCVDNPVGRVISVEGVAGSVDVAAQRFLLAPSVGAARSVAWNSTTYFGAVTPQSLAGQRVEVEGVDDGVVLQALKIKLK